MSEWIMSVVGVIVLSVLVEVLMPEGQLNKYVKGIFSVITLYVIISPLPDIISGKFDFSNSINEGAVIFELDEDFLNDIVSNPFSARETALENYLAECGYPCTVKYVAKVRNNSEVDYINVILTSSSLHGDEPNKNISDDVKELSADFSGIDIVNIRVLYGK